MNKLSKKEKRFRFKYGLGASLIECNLPSEKFQMYLERFIEPESNPLDFAKFLANKTHYHGVKCDGVDLSIKQKVKVHNVVAHY